MADSNSCTSFGVKGLEIESRFWAKVDWDIHNLERCWSWTAGKMHRGYGQFSFVDVDGKQCVARAHRLAYEFEFGPIPETDDSDNVIHVDHLCHDPDVCKAGELCPHRGCCNPSHMALTTNAENHAAGRTNFKSGPGRTPEQLASYRVARWEIPNAREDWAQHMRGRWRAMSPERRLEIGARISAGKRRSSQSSSVLL